MKNYITLIGALIFGLTTHATIIDFDSKNTGINNYYRPMIDGNYAWTDGGAGFNNEVSWFGNAWSGFTYSDVNNPTSTGVENQYAVYGDGRDYSGTGVYAIGYAAASLGFGLAPTISFDSAQTVNGFFVNNTTYAALGILGDDGTGMSRGFTTGDWFKLTVEGMNAGGESQGTVVLLLADFTDYTEGDNQEDYMISDWTWMNLSGLGSDVSSLEFSMDSTDTGSFGINTPAYFALDHIDTIPEPGTIVLMLTGFGGLYLFRRRLKR
ncbi:MAG: DUF4465 domain-containing protein [Pontiella sp.]